MYSRVGFLYHQEREKEKERERESPKALCSVPVCSLRFFSFLFFPSFFSFVCWMLEEDGRICQRYFFSLLLLLQKSSFPSQKKARCSLLPKKIFRSERGSRKTRRRGLFERHRRGSFASFASSSSFFFPRRCFEGFLGGLPRVVHTIFGRSRSNFWREVIV